MLGSHAGRLRADTRLTLPVLDNAIGSVVPSFLIDNASNLNEKKRITLYFKVTEAIDALLLGHCAARQLFRRRKHRTRL